MLRGKVVARRDPGAHDWRCIGKDDSNVKWVIVFDMVNESTARPVTLCRA